MAIKVDCIVIRSRKAVVELELDLLWKGYLDCVKIDEFTTLGTKQIQKNRVESFMIIPRAVYEVVGEKLKLQKLFDLGEIDVEDQNEIFEKTRAKFRTIPQYKFNGYLELTLLSQG